MMKTKSGTIYAAFVVSQTDYLAYGQAMPDRSYNTSAQRYTFNGKEDEIFSEWQDYGFRNYDKKQRRFTSVDPLTAKYPWYTPYQFAGNKVIQFIDLDGLEEASPTGSATPREFYSSLSTANQEQMRNSCISFRELGTDKALQRITDITSNFTSVEDLNLKTTTDFQVAYDALVNLPMFQFSQSGIGNISAIEANKTALDNEFRRTGLNTENQVDGGFGTATGNTCSNNLQNGTPGQRTVTLPMTFGAGTTRLFMSDINLTSPSGGAVPRGFILNATMTITNTSTAPLSI